MLGLLDVVDVRVTGFLMVPVVAVAERQPHFVADPREVAALLTVPVRHFLPDAPVEVVEEERDGWRLRYGAYPVQGYRVWGATGRVLGQLGAVLSAVEHRRRLSPGSGSSRAAPDVSYQGSPSVGSWSSGRDLAVGQPATRHPIGRCRWAAPRAGSAVQTVRDGPPAPRQAPPRGWRAWSSHPSRRRDAGPLASPRPRRG